MSDTLISTSGYTEVLTLKHCSEITDLYKSARHVQDVLNNTYAAIVEKYDNDIDMLIRQGRKQGHFRDALTQITGKLYQKWDLKGPKSRYWRMLVSHIYQQYSSRYKRKQIIRIIEDGGYKKVCPELREVLRENKLFPREVELLNIFKFLGKGEEQKFVLSPVPLDFTTGDDHNVHQDIMEDKVFSSLSLNRKQRFEVTYQIPPSIDQMITRISKPTLFFNDDNELVLKYAIETVTFKSQGDNILGFDPGKVKKFSASSLSPGGIYSQELCPGRELERNSRKEKRLSKNKNSNYKKKERIALLIKGSGDTPDSSLVEKYELLDNEYTSIKNKISRVKEHSSWLAARDAVIHALEQDCSTIHMERLSWVSKDDRQGKWDFAQTQDRVTHKARKFGITTEFVNAAYTSWEYPEPYDQNPAPLAEYNSTTRELVNVNGDRIDKDYAASIAIAARHPLSKCKGKENVGKSRKRAIHPARCRDKNAPTPKRAKRKVMRKFLDEEKKIIKELMDENVDVGGFLLSLSRSVVASGSVVCNSKQLSFNEDHGASGVSAYVT